MGLAEVGVSRTTMVTAERRSRVGGSRRSAKDWRFVEEHRGLRVSGGRGVRGGAPRVASEHMSGVGGSPRLGWRSLLRVASEVFWEGITEVLERQSRGFGWGDRWGTRASRGLEVDAAFTANGFGRRGGFHGEVRGSAIDVCGGSHMVLI